MTGNTAQGNGGGIDTSDGPTTLTNSSVDHNTAVQSGGGIRNLSDTGLVGTLTIDNSTVADNRVTINASAFNFGGGGILNASYGGTASMVATGLTLTGNLARNSIGGGINNTNAGGDATLMTLAHSHLTGNQATLGGGIYNDGSLGPTSLSLQPGTTIVHNQASVDGGGLYNNGGGILSSTAGVVILLNSPDNISDENPGGNS